MAELKNFLDGSGKLVQFPARRKMKLEALAYLAEKFEQGREYTEKEVNELLLAWHTFHDPATLRRELYDGRFLGRAGDGTVYWKEEGRNGIPDSVKKHGCTVRYVKTEEELVKVLRLCYRLLAPELMVTLPGGLAGGPVKEEVGNHIYAYAAWKERMGQYSGLLVYAEEDGVAAAVLGRPENAESLVCGMVACDERYRLRGITKMLMECFAENARSMGFHYITLGAGKEAEGFYDKCGFHEIFEIHGQKIYQKMLV